jgi:PAS domain S-box-containing protein
MSDGIENKVLFVDDEKNVLDSFKRQFRNKLSIETALGGSDGLERIIASGPFAVIVSDLNMEGMDGFTFLEKARKSTPDTVCIMLTGHADLDVAVEAVNTGDIFRFLTKPCPPDVLQQTIDEAIEQYNKLANVTHYTYTSKIKDGVVVYTGRSQGCLAVTGYTPHDLVSDESLWLSMVLPEYRVMVKDRLGDIVAGKQVNPVELMIRKKDGSVRWIRDTIILHKNDQNITEGFEGLFEDITERKDVEVALAQSETRYQRMVANVPGLVFQLALTAQGCMEFVFLSDSCKEFFGVEPDDVKNDRRLLLEKINPEDRAEFYRLIAESAEGLSPCQWRGRVVVDDQERWYQAVASPERLPNDDVLWDGVMLDVTETRKFEQEVVSLAKFPAENPNPVLRISLEGEILYANKSSDPLLQLWDRQVGQELPEDLKKLISKVKGLGFNDCIESQCGDRYYSMVLAVIPEHDYVNIYARDITEVKNAQLELVKTNEILREHDRLKSEFVSTVSHELRTPLCIFKNIVSNAMAGVMGKVSHKLYESLKMADTSIDRLSRIISDFLDISKIESGNMKLDLSVVSIKQIIAETVKSFQSLASVKDIEIQLSVPDEDVFMTADRDRIVQVITNLIGNAIKFIPVNGNISVTLEQREEEVEISVSDDGPGLSKDEIEKIFDRFIQIHLISGPGEHGTGLGLTIAKELIEMHGGKLNVESKPGNGCCFAFTIPKMVKDVDKSLSGNISYQISAE